ncbi:hypothetical protein CPB86DRAFT_54575 [Serendipita vermifera]|nr:hypothetical protein CPB86DRAFT_54575 [Serendipita vermifera]
MRRTITAFRLVCRLWASILSNHYICVFTDFLFCNFPEKDPREMEGVERIHVTAHFDTNIAKDYEEMPCSCSVLLDKPCLFDLQNRSCLFQHSVGWWEDLRDERLKELLLGVRMLSLVLDRRNMDIEKLVSSMPALQAIRIRLDSKGNVHNLRPFPTLFSQQTQLTHLELSRLTWSTFSLHFLPLNPHLQTLRYLHLSFYWTHETSPIGQRTRWDFPKLNTLSVSGILHLGVREEVATFARQYGETLTEFIDLVVFLHGTIVKGSTEALQEGQFPQLHTYGTRIGFIQRQ